MRARRSLPQGSRSAFPTRFLSLVLATVLLPAWCSHAVSPTEPLLFVYDANDPLDFPLLAQLGLNAVYLLPEGEGNSLAASLEPSLAAAARCKLGAIVAVPTVPGAFGMVISAHGERYRQYVQSIVDQVVTALKSDDRVLAWALGDGLETALTFNHRELQAFLQRRYGDLASLNRQWGSAFADWTSITEEACRLADKSQAFGVGRAAVDVADYRQEALYEVLALWARAIKSADPSRPVLSCRLFLYRSLTAVPPDLDILCPFMSPEAVEPDELTHNVHAVDMARRCGRFQVIPCLHVPVEEGAEASGTLLRWALLAALHGARGVSFEGWRGMEESLAPDALRRALGEAVGKLRAAQCFSIAPKPTIAFLYQPYGAGIHVGPHPAYGYVESFSTGEPDNPFVCFRLGTRYGLADYITLEDLPATDLNRYGALMAPLALRLPEAAQNQVARFVRSGGVLVCDLGAGMYETGSWLKLPETLGNLVGARELVAMEEVLGNLSVSWAPGFLPSLEHGLRTQGAYVRPAAPASAGSDDGPKVTVSGGSGASQVRRRQGTAADRIPRHVSGPACHAFLAEGAGAIAVLGVRWHKGQRVIAGLIGREHGQGAACFATHRLWANWLPDDPVYIALHQDLCERRSLVEMQDSPFWTRALCVTAMDRGIAVANVRGAPAWVAAIYFEAGHALHTNAYCTFSALARNPDGTRSGAARLECEVPPLALVLCEPVPVLIQPFTDTCTARLVEVAPSRLVLEVAGHGAEVTRDWRGKPRLAEGAPTEIRFTVRDGTYSVKPGSVHRVVVDQGPGLVTEGELIAVAPGEIRFSETVTRGRVTVTPAPAR